MKRLTNEEIEYLKTCALNNHIEVAFSLYMHDALTELQELRKNQVNNDIDALHKYMAYGRHAIVIFDHDDHQAAYLIDRIVYNRTMDDEYIYYETSGGDEIEGEPIAWIPWRVI